jgi:hypothetical protein
MACSGYSWLRMGPSNILVSIAVTEGKRSPGRPGYRWKKAIKVGLTDKWWCELDSVRSGWAPVRLECTAVNEGKRPLVRTGNGWEYDIKVALTEIWYGVNSAGSGWAPVTK